MAKRTKLTDFELTKYELAVKSGFILRSANSRRLQPSAAAFYDYCKKVGQIYCELIGNHTFVTDPDTLGYPYPYVDVHDADKLRNPKDFQQMIDGLIDPVTVSEKVYRVWRKSTRSKSAELSFGGFRICASKLLPDKAVSVAATLSKLVLEESAKVIAGLKATNEITVETIGDNMLELFKNEDKWALRTDAVTEADFFGDIAEAITQMATAPVLSDNFQENLRAWIPQAFEILCKLRGYKADVDEKRVLTAGARFVVGNPEITVRRQKK